MLHTKLPEPSFMALLQTDPDKKGWHNNNKYTEQEPHFEYVLFWESSFLA